MKTKRITTMLTGALMAFTLIFQHALAVPSDGALTADKTTIQTVSVSRPETAASGSKSIALPAAVTYAGRADGEGLRNLPIGIAVNGTDALRSGSAAEGFSYAVTVGESALTLSFEQKNSAEQLVISATPAVADGEYAIALSFPAEIMADGRAAELNVTFSVGAAAAKRFTVTASAQPAAGGSVTGAGTVNAGDTVTLTAAANPGYTFKGWSENGSMIQGAGAAYSFTAAGHRTLTAVFEAQAAPKMEISLDPLSEVPASLAGTYTSLEALKSDLLKELKQGFTAKNTVFFDVKLRLSDDGVTWRDATVDDFPKEGITVEFLFSEIGKGVGYGHSFMAAHMFTETSDRLNTTAGRIELPKVTKLKDRIQVTFKGLSPVSISWKNAPATSYGETPTVTFPMDDTRVVADIGSAPTLSITAKNARSYQWQFNTSDSLWGWQNIENANSPTLPLPKVFPENDGCRFRCVVTNSYGSIVSPTFTLRITNSLSELPKTGGDPGEAAGAALLLISAAALLPALRRRGR